jgi:hypothetical protein
MKLILFAHFLLMSCYSFGQVKIIEPQIYYASEWQFSITQEFTAGRKIVFRQECNPEIPADIVTGMAFLENVRYEKEQFSMAIEFKDTVVVAVTYYLSAKQTAILKTIGYSDIKANPSATKGQWTSISNEPAFRTVIVGDRKRIVVVQTINEKSAG